MATLPDTFIFSAKNRELFDSEPGIDRLKHLAKVNLFVGPNNSGKSRVIRDIFYQHAFGLSSHSEDDIKDIRSLKRDFINEAVKSFRNHGFLAASQLFVGCIAYRMPGLRNDPLPGELFAFERFLENIVRNRWASVLRPEDCIGIEENEFSHLRAVAQNSRTTLDERFRKLAEKRQSSPRSIYIPVLRGMRQVGEGDVYETRTWNDYFGNDVIAKHTIFTGLGMHKAIRDHLLGSLKDRAFIAQYERWLSRTFFDHKPITLIPKDDHDIPTIKIGMEKERPIHEVGDGLQQLILITFSVHMSWEAEPALFFIEEPELYLHPGYQRTLLNFMTGDEFPNAQFYLTTHSNHFLELTQDIGNTSVYRVRKELPGSESDEMDARVFVEYTNIDDRGLLDALGVTNASVYLSNCTIWVEGITDRRYYRRFLELYVEHLGEGELFKEDLHFSFVEYGGSNISHWSFLDNEDDSINVERLCGKLFLICDKDHKKELRHDRLKKALGDRVYVLRSLEVENVLPPAAILNVVAHYEDEGLERKTDFEWKDYKAKRLGRYIDTQVLKHATKSKRYRKVKGRARPYSEKSGTVKRKKDFARLALEVLTDYNDLTAEAKDIAKRLYNFIKANN